MTNSLPTTFWAETHKNSQLHSSLYEQLVPEIGSPNNLEGWILLAANRLYYDYYNNSFTNFESRESDLSFLEGIAFEYGIRKETQLISTFFEYLQKELEAQEDCQNPKPHYEIVDEYSSLEEVELALNDLTNKITLHIAKAQSNPSEEVLSNVADFIQTHNISEILKVISSSSKDESKEELIKKLKELIN